MAEQRFSPQQLAVMDRAGKLQGLRRSAGWPFIVAISEQACKEAVDALMSYPKQGDIYDPATRDMLFARARSLREWHDTFLATIDALIQQGVTESSQPQESAGPSPLSIPGIMQ